MKPEDLPPLEGDGGAPRPGGQPRRGLAPVPARTRSWAWFLLPVFVDVIGGALAYWALRLDSPRMARDCLYVGITLTAVKAVTMAITILALGSLGDALPWAAGGGVTIEDPAMLEECLEGTVGFDGSASSIDRDGAMACLRAHALGAPTQE